MVFRAAKESNHPGHDIDVRPVNNFIKINKFIRFPWSVYRDDPAWIAPLKLERRLHFSKLNPFFKHGEWQAWLAYRDGQMVGRISAQIDTLHREIYGEDTGHFGFIEAIEDANVFEALCKVAEKWLYDRGARRITGPLGFSLNQECGLLIDGFEHPPMLMMPHSRPWYGPMLEEQGYSPVKDLLAYWINIGYEPTKMMTALSARYGSKIKIRSLNLQNFTAEMALLRDIFNDAWSENWGFVPFTEAEFTELGTTLRLIVPEEYIQIAEIEGEAVAFIVALPNINEIIKDLNGSLFPLGWLKIIWRIRRAQIKTGRVPLMGVRKKFQNKPISLALVLFIIESVRHNLSARGIKEVEMSWILEDNSAMRHILDHNDGKMYKRYRLYEKTLAN